MNRCMGLDVVFRRFAVTFRFFGEIRHNMDFVRERLVHRNERD